jgi:hypothetical protein
MKKQSTVLRITGLLSFLVLAPAANISADPVVSDISVQQMNWLRRTPQLPLQTRFGAFSLSPLHPIRRIPFS